MKIFFFCFVFFFSHLHTPPPRFLNGPGRDPSLAALHIHAGRGGKENGDVPALFLPQHSDKKKAGWSVPPFPPCAAAPTSHRERVPEVAGDDHARHKHADRFQEGLGERREEGEQERVERERERGGRRGRRKQKEGKKQSLLPRDRQRRRGRRRCSALPLHRSRRTSRPRRQRRVPWTKSPVFDFGIEVFFSIVDRGRWGASEFLCFRSFLSEQRAGDRDFRRGKCC